MAITTRNIAASAYLTGATAQKGLKFLLACLLPWLFASAALAQPVTAQSQSVQTAFNKVVFVALQAADATPGGPHALTYAITSGPSHGSFFGNSLNLQTGTFSYQPAPDYYGSDSITFTASNAHGTSAPATVHITVDAPLPPLAFDNQHFSVPFNTTRDLLLTYSNVNFSLTQTNYAPTFEFVTPPAHGSATFHLNAATYTPTINYSGPDSFTYRIVGRYGTSNTVTATIDVAAAGLPVAQPGRQFVPHGTATAIPLAAQDGNPGGPWPLTYAAATQPAHGGVTVSGSTATYTPASGYWGEDSFTYTATSANGTSAPAAVRVLVGQPVTLGVPGGRGDTGQVACTDSAGMAILCAAPSAHPGQDGRFGRDAQAGAAAFDLVADSGCVQDRVTGLTWSDETLTGPWASFNGMAYSRCGIASGWRLPTRRELLTTVHHGASHPASTLPNTQNAPYWSSDAQGANAWAVDFADGNTTKIPQAQTHAARLVALPVNQPPTITLGAAEIVLSNNEMPGPRSYPGWATGITPGPAREAGQQLTATVRLLPVPGIKTLTFDVPPAIDPATGDLTFTVEHRIYPKGQLPVYDPQFPNTPPDQWPVRDVFYWASAAGRVRVEVTLQDDGGTAGGGVDSTVQTFDIALSPVPFAFDVPIKHPWKAACIPVTMHAQDIDTDTEVSVTYPLRYAPLFRIKTHPSEGFLTDYVARLTPDGDEAIRFASARGSFDYVLPKTGMVKVDTQSAARVVPSPARAAALSTKSATSTASTSGISVPLGDTVDSVPDHVGITGSRAPVTGPVSPWGFYADTVCYVPFSTTSPGSDVFTYTVVDVDGNESAPASVSIEIYEVK
jgi:hypothetical protein